LRTEDGADVIANLTESRRRHGLQASGPANIDIDNF
jgi:hypothetical protein